MASQLVPGVRFKYKPCTSWLEAINVICPPVSCWWISNVISSTTDDRICVNYWSVCYSNDRCSCDTHCRNTWTQYYTVCKSGRMYHVERKDSDFNESRQPEMVMWPHKPEILIYPRLWQISAANPCFCNTASLKKVSLGDYNNDRQTEIAAETGNSYNSEIRQISLKLQRQTWSLRPRGARFVARLLEQDGIPEMAIMSAPKQFIAISGCQSLSQFTGHNFSS